jgi:hypothetical protein
MLQNRHAAPSGGLEGSAETTHTGFPDPWTDVPGRGRAEGDAPQ